MQTTTNYGFNIVEGTDIVNPLTQLNPNFTALDADLKQVADATVDAATCIKTGTVHAVTRTNTSASIFKFTATGNWNSGDTMTVDGALVSIYLPDGSAPSTGCFVINSEVIAAIQGSRVTLYVNLKAASNISFDDTSVIYTAINSQSAIENASTAAGTEYTAGTSVKDMLDTKVIPNASLSYNANISNGSTNSSAVRIGNIVKVSMASVTTSGNINANYALISNLPADAYSFSTGVITLNRGGTIIEGVVYMNSTNLCTQFPILAGDVIYGSILYITA